MKRGVVIGSLSLFVVACGPGREPRQVSVPDPITDDLAAGSPSSPNGGSNVTAAPGGGPISGGAARAAKNGKGTAAQVASLASFQDGLRWGMSHDEIIRRYTQTNGIIWRDYDERLSRARVGPEMIALEAERDRERAAFVRSYIEFNETPTGYDATGIKGEYTYKNHEALMSIERQGKKRFFFFINDRLWKIYDEVPLSESGNLGNSFQEAVLAMNAKLGAKGHVLGADPSKGAPAMALWRDNTSQLRLVDRSGSQVVGVVVEDSATRNNLDALRANKVEDVTAVDPAVTAVTKGGLSDPNAAQQTGTANPTKKAPPKKK
ncbi:MAG: hypothetical protein FWD69_18275 [Polyangiaceae bacterium]|nr:hypothetical protein [Polyangiaceae bacterium]